MDSPICPSRVLIVAALRNALGRQKSRCRPCYHPGSVWIRLSRGRGRRRSREILMVAEDFPWPSLGGGSIRLAKMVETVSAMGETDLFSLYDPHDRTGPAAVGGREQDESRRVSRRRESPLVALVVAAPRNAQRGLHERL